MEYLGPSQPKSSVKGASAAVPIFEPSAIVPVPVEPIPTKVGVNSSWPCNIQHLVLVLTRTTSFLEEPNLSVLITKNALGPEDRHSLNEVEMNKLLITSCILPWIVPSMRIWPKSVTRL